jgi:hypothetical protein
VCQDKSVVPSKRALLEYTEARPQIRYLDNAGLHSFVILWFRLSLFSVSGEKRLTSRWAVFLLRTCIFRLHPVTD